MQELDLGDEVQLNVKYKGKEYVLREPTVGEVESINAGDANKMDVPEFLGSLGMPKDIVRGMGLSKANALVEGLISLVAKKK